MAAAVVAITAFFMGGVFLSAAWPLVDPDTWWHIRAGQEVIATGTVPRIDTWSIVGAGRPWTSQDWLANVLLAAGYEAGPWGWTAISLAFAGITTLSFVILWNATTLRAPTVGWFGRITFLAGGLVLAATVVGARVQVVDLLMASLVLWLCWRYMVDPRARWLSLLPVIAVVWANLHAGWVLMFLIGGAVIVGEGADRILGRTVDGRAPLEWPQLRNLGLSLLGSGAGLVLNPNGVDLYRYPFDTVGITVLRDYILEWFPATLDRLPGQLLAAFTVLIIVPSIVWGRRHLRIADGLVLIGFTIMAATAIRFLLIIGPIGGAIGAIALAPVLSRATAGMPIRRTLASLSEPGHGQRAMAHIALAGVVGIASAGIALARVSPTAQTQAIAKSLPVAANEWLQNEGIDGRMFNRYEWGGFLGQQRPDRLVFMDGRADVYGDDLLHMYVALITLATDPQALMDEYEVDYVVSIPRRRRSAIGWTTRAVGHASIGTRSPPSGNAPDASRSRSACPRGADRPQCERLDCAVSATRRLCLLHDGRRATCDWGLV